jgi:hypothetical protein
MSHVLVLEYQSETWTRAETGDCGIDLSCNAEWQRQYPLNVVLECVFDLNNPLGTIDIGGHVHGPYKRGDHSNLLVGALVFFGIACCGCAVFMCVFAGMYGQRAFERRRHIRTTQVVDQSADDEFVTAEESRDGSESDSLGIVLLSIKQEDPDTSDDSTSLPSYRAVTGIHKPEPLALPNYTDISEPDGV